MTDPGWESSGAYPELGPAYYDAEPDERPSAELEDELDVGRAATQAAELEDELDLWLQLEGPEAEAG